MARGMDMQALMRQAQKMQSDMARAQEELKETVVEGVAGGGMVKVKANCANDILGIEINPEVVDPEDVEMLQDLITAAVNEAMRQVDEMSGEEMGKLTGGLNIPGLM